ncbi:MAG: type II secretion system major pseudopilin GspG [Marinobacterium sp.]|nr:type II secretion system major pseudopilin GspG [Marinobacterium sp.]
MKKQPGHTISTRCSNTFYSKPCPTHQQGFTLLELLVVLIILGLLAGLVGPQIMNQLGGAKSQTARLQMEELGAALDLYRLEVGRYPNSQQGLVALIEKPDSALGWNGPYLKKQIIRNDPWGYPYQYRSPGNQAPYEISTLGADQKPGGEGEDQDIYSWQ